jgi:hypothetical protein
MIRISPFRDLALHIDRDGDRDIERVCMVVFVLVCVRERREESIFFGLCLFLFLFIFHRKFSSGSREIDDVWNRDEMFHHDDGEKQ